MKENKKKVLLVQPHSDDVLFSAFNFIANCEHNTEVNVLTIENNEKRVKEDEKLYDFLGVPYSHLEVPFVDETFYSFHKKYDDVTEDNSIEHLINCWGRKTVEAIYEEVVNHINDVKKSNKGVQIVVPYGVGHPTHCFIRQIVESVDDNLLYYRDFPHSFKKRAKKQIERQSLSYELVKSVDVTNFHDIKWDLARKFYRTQSGLFWFEQNYINKKLPEEIYKKRTK